MNITTYKEKTSRTLPDLGSLEANLSHMALGLATEVGEIVDCTGTELKRRIDIPLLVEELGDTYWYLANYCNIRNLPIPEIVEETDVQEDMCLDCLIASTTSLIDLVKRLLAYKKEIDKGKELEAIYNIYAALQLFQKAYSLNGDEIREKNIAKLFKRYPEKFSEYLAVNRNLDEERKVLEQ